MIKSKVNTPEWREAIKKHKEIYVEIQKYGVVKSLKKGIIKNVGISVSGGKDSVATLIWAKNNVLDIEGVRVNGYYVHTPLENIDIINYIKYLEKAIGIKINIIEYTSEEFKNQSKLLFESSEKNGPPFTIRQCTVYIKGPLFNKINNDNDINFVGVRWKESELRKNVSKLFRQDFNIYYHPIVSFSKQDVFNYIKDNKIKLYWSYKYADRLGCSACPLALGKRNPKELFYILKAKDNIDWQFYDKWYDSMSKFKYDKSGISYVKRHNYLISNYRKLKEQIKKGADFDIKPYDVPVCGWFE